MSQCIRCGDILSCDECDCGWKKPATTTILLKNYDYREDNNDIHKTLAYQLSTLDKRVEVDKLKENAPSLKFGSSKKDVSKYWMGNIKMILGTK